MEDWEECDDGNVRTGDGCTEWCYRECTWLVVDGGATHPAATGLYERSNSSRGRSVWRSEVGGGIVSASNSSDGQFTGWVIANGDGAEIGADRYGVGALLFADDASDTPNAVRGSMWYDASSGNWVPKLQVYCLALLGGGYDNLQAARELISWGDNTFGQLMKEDDGFLALSGGREQPTRVGVFGDDGLASHISLGCTHGLAVSDGGEGGGEVWAWGSNVRGELGTDYALGLATANALPTHIELSVNASKVAAGGRFSIVLATDGSVWSWGSNQRGSLGRPTTREDGIDSTPGSVVGVPPLFKIAAGAEHAAGIAVGGYGVWMWGRNKEGQLGRSLPDGAEFTHEASVVAALEDVNITAIALGKYHTVALSASGDVYTWGSNLKGQCGPGVLGIRSEVRRVDLLSPPGAD